MLHYQNPAEFQHIFMIFMIFILAEPFPFCPLSRLTAQLLASTPLACLIDFTAYGIVLLGDDDTLVRLFLRPSDFDIYCILLIVGEVGRRILSFSFSL